jgi:hypothetical protein
VAYRVFDKLNNYVYLARIGYQCEVQKNEVLEQVEVGRTILCSDVRVA